MTIFSPQHMSIPTKQCCPSQLTNSFLQAKHEHEIRRFFSIFELYSTHCPHHGSFCPSQNSHLTFLQAQCFTSIQYCQPYIALINSHFQLWRKSPAIQQLTALPTHNPTTSCSGSHSNLTSSIDTHPVTKICEFTYSLNFIS